MLHLSAAGHEVTIIDALGLEPILLETGLLAESLEIAQKYCERVDVARIPASSYWNEARRMSAEGCTR